MRKRGVVGVINEEVNFWNPPSERSILQRQIFTLMKTYTRAQLALRNGQDKEEIWCAYRGIIYDLTHSRLWRHGKHYEHWAGQDLTDELPDAPHGEGVFKRFAVIGKLV